MNQVRDRELRDFFIYVIEVLENKHLNDARGVLTMQWGQLNLDAIRRGANGAGMLSELENLIESARRDLE